MTLISGRNAQGETVQTEYIATSHIYGPESEGGPMVLLAAPGDAVAPDIAKANADKVGKAGEQGVTAATATVTSTQDTGIASSERRAELAAENEAIQMQQRAMDAKAAGAAFFAVVPADSAVLDAIKEAVSGTGGIVLEQGEALPDIQHPGELQDEGQQASTLAEGAGADSSAYDPDGEHKTRDAKVAYYNEHLADGDDDKLSPSTSKTDAEQAIADKLKG